MNRRAFLQLPKPPPFEDFPPRAHRVPKPAREAANVPALQPLDIQAGLEAYSAPLDRRRAAHILRRTGFGANPDEVDALVGMTADAAIDVLVDQALGAPLPDPPTWVNEPLPPRNAGREARDQFIQDNQQWALDFRTDWVMRMFYGGLRERLTLFWHNHFVTEIDTYFLAAYAYRYLTTLRTHALGNVNDFVRAIGIESAMLIYLNGNQNVVEAPNENYARELLELFTMSPFDGQGNENYTQQDIEEIARAFTGWAADPYTLTVQLITLFHDNGEKTVFGRTGNWGYDEVVDLLFEERPHQIAAFIARKLYQEFVYAAPDEALVADLADVFVENDFEIAPVLRVLFKSAHFNDEQTIGAQIKNPMLMMTSLLREVHFQNPPANLFRLLDRFAYFMEQRLLDPPNVAGWDGHRAWLNTTTLPARWLISEFLVYGGRNQMPVDLVPVAELLLNQRDEPIDPSDPVSAFALPLALAEHLVPVPVETLDVAAPSEDFAGDLVNNPIPDDILNGPPHALGLAKIFLAGVPWYEWDLYRPEAPQLLSAYTRFLTLLPEFQLT